MYNLKPRVDPIREACEDPIQIKTEHVLPQIMSNILSLILYLNVIVTVA